MADHWMQRVSDVFDTNPRNGNRDATVWLKRGQLERDFESDLFVRGRHICLDGCSGSGKSSLVITTLIKHQIPYTTVQVTRKMDWETFCRQLISKTPGKAREFKATAGGEWKGLFPTGKLEVSFGTKADDKVDHELWEKVVKSATEHTIAAAIAEQNCIVLLDEFERAQADLANSISEVCKILTQSFTSSMGKLVILGADDVFKKLYDAYSTLDNRLVHHSIPTLPTPQESWAYLRHGFRKLQKYYPGTSRYGQPGDEKRAMQAVFLAADGLLKSLTELGVEICKLTGPDTRGVSLLVIEKACAAFDAKNFAKYRAKFSELHRLAEKEPITAAILLYINNHGLGQIHDKGAIEDGLAQYGRSQVEDAILALWKQDFLVMTGESN
ncbi:MAG: AAA family ATPase, partial [Burkholderiales bacterium]|nr:AAA family ATPase [Burkholderiales bacterium]